MSMFYCHSCDNHINLDFHDIREYNGRDVCDNCFDMAVEDESKDVRE